MLHYSSINLSTHRANEGLLCRLQNYEKYLKYEINEGKN